MEMALFKSDTVSTREKYYECQEEKMSPFSFASPLMSNGLPLANASQQLGWLEPSDATPLFSQVERRFNEALTQRLET